MTTVLMVGAGGAIGASLRYVWGVAVLRAFGRGDIPVAILSANVLGSVLMGLFVVLAAEKGLNAYAPFVMTGLLGGFTTFSAFSLETVNLIQRGDVLSAGVYVAASVALSVGGLMLGLWVARGFYA